MQLNCKSQTKADPGTTSPGVAMVHLATVNVPSQNSSRTVEHRMFHKGPRNKNQAIGSTLIVLTKLPVV